MSQSKVTVSKRDTNLRRGGSIHGPDNIITVLHQPATYVALEQCAGGNVTEGAAKSYWWVRIEVPIGGAVITGWVSAVRIEGGGNGQPLDVPQFPTWFEAHDSAAATAG